MNNIPSGKLSGSELKRAFTHNLNRMYYGKCYLNEQMPDLIERASFRALKLALTEIHQDAKNQIVRMKEMYALINENPADEAANPIKSILKDEFCMAEAGEMAVLNDIDIILYVQILEHINITAYRLMKIIAPTWNRKEVEQLLTECFDESVEGDYLFVLITQEYVGQPL